MIQCFHHFIHLNRFHSSCYIFGKVDLFGVDMYIWVKMLYFMLFRWQTRKVICFVPLPRKNLTFFASYPVSKKMSVIVPIPISNYIISPHMSAIPKHLIIFKLTFFNSPWCYFLTYAINLIINIYLTYQEGRLIDLMTPKRYDIATAISS